MCLMNPSSSPGLFPPGLVAVVSCDCILISGAGLILLALFCFGLFVVSMNAASGVMANKRKGLGVVERITGSVFS